MNAKKIFDDEHEIEDVDPASEYETVVGESDDNS